MNREQILVMPAGTKANQYIWWHVFDMKPTPPHNDMFLLPDYSGEISPAWSVVEKLGYETELHTHCNFGNYPNYPYGCKITVGPKVYFCLAETMPLAICRAALLVMNDGVRPNNSLVLTGGDSAAR